MSVSAWSASHPALRLREKTPSCSRNNAADARRSVLIGSFTSSRSISSRLSAFWMVSPTAREMTLGADEFAVEQAVHELGRKLVSAGDQVDQTGSDHDPGPVGHVDVLVDRLDLLVEEEDRHAEQKAEERSRGEAGSRR